MIEVFCIEVHIPLTLESTNDALLFQRGSQKNTLYTMILVICFIGALVITSGFLLLRRHRTPVDVGDVGNVSRIQNLRTLTGRHETASILLELLDKDGAGAWPPKANHDSWPMALRAYKETYLELAPLLSTAEPSLDDNVNIKRMHQYRSLMRKLLTERINIVQIEDIMAAVEAGDWENFPRDAYNGFYACIAVCRHAYR